MAKKKLVTKIDEELEVDEHPHDDDLDVEAPENITEEVIEDDTAYTMGAIIVDDGNSSEEDDDENKKAFQASSIKKKDEEDEEDDDVWVDDVDVFDDVDPYLENEDFDPENQGDYYD